MAIKSIKKINSNKLSKSFGYVLKLNEKNKI